MRTGAWFKVGMSATIAGILLAAALSLGVSRADAVKYNPGGPDPGIPPGGAAGIKCDAGGPTACITCAAGTGFYCVAGPPPPTVTGGTWWIGACQAGAPTDFCANWWWDCGSSMTCPAPGVWTRTNCAAFVLCN